MRIVFCGTAHFAVPSLRALVPEHEVVAVVTQPDRSGSRGRPAPRPVGETAARLGLPMLRPERIRAPESVAEILSLAPDALVVAAYGQIIPALLLDASLHGGVNVHGSLLPRWRGAAPVAAAILAGDTRTGVSIMRMDAGLDTGPVYATSETEIGADQTAPSLTGRLADAGARLLLEVLSGLEDGSVAAVAQDDSQATYAPRLRREDGNLEWSSIGAVDLDRRVRALQPWPGVTAPLGGQPVRILEGAPAGSTDATGAPGEVLGLSGEAADVATMSGVYRLARVQPAGSRPMTAAAYLRGRRVQLAPR
ncbi:MAG: methionyl-tRNA formyltransferase [Candidatus Dormibacteraeota bacterium]|uniref:Methionyl-tRNA formyltransferase n=1 Tax=Candidatus Aeolococcus gillhamiae TaxID=3127015 RepID=A0A2W5Z6N1_9BACT|nr:methionyl-tRNA formyltransferase [Candidatus Dormibacteraeota bacterium]PZR78505.1 MAG: methionyl-tRNA formyltransferase [Candidatus Dormibacter sp. RRmetagenome_bin12]